MYNPDTDLLFPERVIPSLRDLRGPGWRALVARVNAAGSESIENLAFILMMARLDGCASCNADSYRAMHGCTACAKQSLKRFRGSDDELLALYTAAKSEVEAFLPSSAAHRINLSAASGRKQIHREDAKDAKKTKE